MATRKKTVRKSVKKAAGTAQRKTARGAATPRGVTRSSPAARGGAVRGATPASAAVRSASASAERLRALKLQLQAAQDKLLLIDPNRLDDVAHAAWSNEIFELSRAINALRNVLLEQLSADFLAELPDIEDASKDLADELSELEDAVDVINAVAGVLSVIARVATLVA
jgi:hypothetical protein